jgi:peptide/nickel transport system substrate-binding protein
VACRNLAGKPLAWSNSLADDAVIKITADAVREPDGTTRKQVFLGEQLKVLDECPYAILFREIKQVATRANVKNFNFGPSAEVVYYDLITK